MISNDKNNFSREYQLLGEMFSKCEKLKNKNTKKDPPAWELADALLDIENSSKMYINELLPKLKKGNLNEDEIMGILIEVGQEFQHILYHVKNTEFYKYVWENAVEKTEGT